MASEEDIMRNMMGFSGFGAKKPPKEEILNQKLNEAKRLIKSDCPFFDNDEDVAIGPSPSLAIVNDLKNEIEKNVKETVKDDDSDSDYSEGDDFELTPIQKIPMSHEITLLHGQKVVSAMALDPSGSRLATGSYDYEVKFWDFNSMDVSLRPFRTLTPADGHWVNALQYSATGDRILVSTGNAQPQVLDRDGHQVYECKKGDQYIVDMKNTKGHVSMVRNSCWDPRDKNHFISCGDDGTIRLWDINTVKKNTDVIRMKNKQSKKTGVTFCLFNRDGKLIVGSGQDGSIQGWDTRRLFVNTSLSNMQAHTNGSETSCLCLSSDEKSLISRGGDDTLKYWDLRNFQKPVAVAKDLVSYYTTTKCLFSPDEKLIVTGTSAKKGGGNGKLVFLERDTLNIAHELDFGNTSVVCSLWHVKLNQILVGLSDGNIKVLFDPTRSIKGATLCVGKVKNKRVDPGEGLVKPQIINPITLKLYREKKAETMKKIKAKQRADPIASHKPEAPLGLSHGVGGRMKEGMSLTGFVIKNIALAKADTANPREAILKHAKAAAEDPFWIAPAYSKTQPNPIFTTKSDSDSEDEDNELVTVKRQKVD
ncbi:WD repeat-containing protein 70 [Hydra vulgaris]|uniref:WD repeat-containing protein 70 n=1 Tax=Hydra vulgaris TaxID=6087 RepID=A0ABM4BI07_HYDVU